MSFSSWPVQYTANPMTLASFLAITGFLVNIMNMSFTMLDGIVIIQSPQMTILDYFLVCIVIEELWDLWDFLRAGENYV
jgi:hypothetical protein